MKNKNLYIAMSPLFIILLIFFIWMLGIWQGIFLIFGMFLIIVLLTKWMEYWENKDETPN